MDEVGAELQFLARDELYEKVKPYSMCYKPMGDLKQSILIPQKYFVTMKSIRNANGLAFDHCGFDFLNLESKMSYEDFDDPQKIASIYAPEISAALKDRLSAQHVYVTDYAIRRRHPEFPVSTGKDYADTQPTSIVHVDFTQEEAIRMLKKLYGNRASEVLNHHWQIVNVWRPLKGPVRDWPLAICNAESFDWANDGVPGDIVYKDWVTENMQVHYSPEQQWYWLPEQTTSEPLIFKSADSQDSVSQACPHTSFFNTRAGPDEPLRESIDCRVFVLYAEKVPPEVGTLFGETN